MQLTGFNAFNYGRNKIALTNPTNNLHFILSPFVSNQLNQALYASVSYCSNAFSVRNLVVLSSGSLPVQFQIWHEARYIHEQAALAMTFPALRSPLIQLSATVGTPHLGFGMVTAYNTSSRQFTMLDAGISLTNSYLELSRENRGDFLSASYIHYFDHERKVAAAAVIGRTFSRKENAFAVGGAWIVDDLTTIKTRYDSFGKVVTALQHKIKPKSSLTIIGEFEPKALDKTPSIRLGLSLVL